MAHPSGRTLWHGLAFGLAVAVFGAYLQLKLPPVLPAMREAFGYSRLLAGGFMSIFAVAGLALSLTVGRLMQVHGSVRYLLGACALAVAGGALILAAPHNGWLVLAGRGLEGIAMAVLAVAGPTLMTRNAGPRHMALAAALAATWVPLGGLLASGAARLGHAVSGAGAAWPAVFWLGLAGAGALALAIGALARTRAPEAGGVDLHMPVPQRGAVAPDGARRLALGLAGACFFLWSTQNMALLTWLPTYLIERAGMDGRTAATLYALPIALVALFNLIAVPILARGVAIGRLLTLALIGQAALFLAVPLLPLQTTPAFGVAVLVLYGALAGLTPTCLYGMPAAVLGGARTGAGAFGVLMTGRNLGVLAGPLAVAGLVDLMGPAVGWDLAAPAIGAVTLAAALVAALLARRLARLEG